MCNTLDENLFTTSNNTTSNNHLSTRFYNEKFVKRLIPCKLDDYKLKLFQNKKFLILVQSILKLIEENRPSKIEYENIRKCKQLLGYFLDSSFYKWRYRTIELLKIPNIGGHTARTYELKWGTKEGKKRWDAYRNFQSVKNTFEYKHKKYGMTKEEFDAYNKSRAVTLENMITRYGDKEGIERWNSYCEKQKYAGCALEYFQEKYGDKEGLKRYNEINSQKRLNEETFIRKYGEIEGKIKFQDYLKSLSKRAYFSKTSQEFFDELYAMLPSIIQKDCHYGKLNNEYVVHFEHTTYLYDFVISSLKYCIEYNGDYWHANPEIYDAADVIRYPGGNKIEACEIWENDSKKITAIKEYRGYDVDIVWEMDYKKDPRICLEKFYEKIMQRYQLGIK